MRLELTALMCLLGATVAQFPFIGKCPSPKVQDNFDFDKFQGMWFEIERTMSFLEIGSQCTQSNFSYAGVGYNGGEVQILNEGRSSVLKLKKSLRIINKVPDKTQPAKMKLRLPDLGISMDYWIIKTDYESYAVIWGCRHVNLAFQYARTENLWILSRERTLSDDTLEKIRARLKAEKEIRATKLLQTVNQKDCEDFGKEKTTTTTTTTTTQLPEWP